jgi:hypothetical protein
MVTGCTKDEFCLNFMGSTMGQKDLTFAEKTKKFSETEGDSNEKAGVPARKVPAL